MNQFLIEGFGQRREGRSGARFALKRPGKYPGVASLD